MNEMNRTYAGIPEKLSQPDFAKIGLYPIAYDETSSWGKGADRGPEAFLDASENMELYDIETQSEVYKNGIHLRPTLDLTGMDPDKMYEATLALGRETIEKESFPTFFGGEHSISIGLIDAFLEKYPDLTVLQIDAHADLRPEYEGTPFNHACALYRASRKANLVQVGIRSMDIDERRYLEADQCFFAHDIHDNTFWMGEALSLIKSPVYITFDLDAFDPSILSATGTPEPGGMDWYGTLEFLRMVFRRKNVVGFDIVELCPNPTSMASNMAAASTLR